MNSFSLSTSRPLSPHSRRVLAGIFTPAFGLWLAAFVVTGCRTTEEAAAPSHGASSESSQAPEQTGEPTHEDAPTPAVEHVALPTSAVEVNGAPTAVDEKVEPADDIVALLAPRAKIVSARANRVVGSLSAPMARGKPQSTLGNFVADAMRTGTESVAGIPVDVCFTNSGGLRVDLAAGKVTEGMVVELMPFDNAIVVLKMDGKRLKTLAQKVAQRGDPVSGLHYRTKGRGASDLKVGGAPIDPGKMYSVCTNDYVYEGGSNYGLDDVKDAYYTGILIREAILQAFETAHKDGITIHPALDDRVQEG